MKITVMGLGYIGLPTAITLAEAGFEVCGFDVNKKTIETLQGGHIHIVEPGLQEAIHLSNPNSKPTIAMFKGFQLPKIMTAKAR